MRKLLLAILVSVSTIGYASEYIYAQAFAIQDRSSGVWTEWSKCIPYIPIELNGDQMVIYSETPQAYSVVDSKDNSTGKEIRWTYYCLDYRYEKCRIEYRQYKENGVYENQLYIIYSDYMWVYDIAN